MRGFAVIVALALAGLAGLTGAAVAGPKVYGVSTSQATVRAFNALEKRLITEALGGRKEAAKPARKPKTRKFKFGRNHGKGGGRGRGRSGGLPPGLENQLKLSGKLPPGLEGRELPSGLKGRLPPPGHGTRRVIIGRDVVLVDKAKNVVLDILRDVIKTR